MRMMAVVFSTTGVTLRSTFYQCAPVLDDAVLVRIRLVV
jgi:hypothetical protein